jgi:chromosome segregation ATPase
MTTTETVLNEQALLDKIANALADQYAATMQQANDLADEYARQLNAVTEEGMYEKDGTIYRVVASKESGRWYAKQLSVDSYNKARFEYAAGAIYNLRSTDRMTVEEVASFGLRIGSCAVCARTLTDEQSIAAGIGPVCAKRV